MSIKNENKTKYPDECPCRHCVPPIRTSTCHCTCQNYKTWKAQLNKFNEEQFKQLQNDRAHFEYGMGRSVRRRKK